MRQIDDLKPSLEDLKSELKKTFGHYDFREGQVQIIQRILMQESILAIMPTGAGKSVCYQLPAIISDYSTIVISPLVSLIDDQTRGLKENGVKVSKIHSGQDYQLNVKNWKSFHSGDTKILYLSPERLMQERMISALKHHNIGSFVIDEAHCISKWGAGFRPDYEALSKLTSIFPNANIAAFTATADKQTRNDIASKFFIKKSHIFMRGFDRPNLFLEVRQKEHFKESLLQYLKNRQGLSGIIYCLSRRETDEITVFLSSNGFNAIAYHAGKSTEYRKEAYDRFGTELAVIMVATIAFGMGIDKSDIRFVVHVSLPGNMESFYQEIGRAGRDNLPSETLLFYGLGDLIQRKRMILEADGSDKFKLFEYKRLEALVGYCETISCRRKVLLGYFDQQISDCQNCDNCIHPPVVKNYSENARIIIETIRSTGQRFGSNHVIDVILGKETEKVRAYSHNVLKEFGSGSHYSKRLLQVLIRQLIAFGALKVNLEKYGALEITELALGIANGNQTFNTREYTGRKKPSKLIASNNFTTLSSDNTDLLQILKKLRLNIAKKQKIPSYIIFSDKTLMQLAELKPLTSDGFLEIDGIGHKKMNKYYSQFSQAIKDHLIVKGLFKN